MPESTKIRDISLAVALLSLIVIFPLYYIYFCDWCGGVVFSYFWGLVVMTAGTVFVYRKAPAAGIICALLSISILLLSAHYVTFMWIWSAGALFLLGGILKDIKNREKKEKKRTIIFIGMIFFIVSIFFSIRGFSSMREMMKLRNIHAVSIDSIILKNESQKIIISKPLQQNKILIGLQESYAYLPNHEGIRDTWELTIVLKDKHEITIKVGKSTNAYPDAVYIKFSGADYQSRTLYKVLQPLLWHK